MTADTCSSASVAGADSFVAIPALHPAQRTVLYLLALAVTLSSGGAAAIAQVHTGRAIANFASIDTDRDAKLDARELAAAADRDFRRLDIDRDGYLTRGELARTRGKQLLLPFPGRFSSQSAFMAADTDHDQKIDEREYRSAVVGAYMRCDRNHDNAIELHDLRHCSL